MIDSRPPRVKPRLLLGLRDTNQRTALLCACCVSDNAAAASVLLENGADVDAEDGHAVRPLHLAAMQGDVELLKALLPHKPDLDAKDGQGMSVTTFSISAIDFFHLLATLARICISLTSVVLGRRCCARRWRGMARRWRHCSMPAPTPPSR